MSNNQVPSSSLTHLRPGEITLFRRFELLNPFPNAIYQFDFRLGYGITLDPAWPAWLQRMATSLTQRRVDLLAMLPDSTWILEIKVRAGPAAVGQLVTYKALYERDYGSSPPVYLGIIADRNSYDMLPAYEIYRIKLILV